MGSDVTYKNRIINNTFEPALTPIIFVVSLLCLIGSIFFIYMQERNYNQYLRLLNLRKNLLQQLRVTKVYLPNIQMII